jgi:hypothetical protein
MSKVEAITSSLINWSKSRFSGAWMDIARLEGYWFALRMIRRGRRCKGAFSKGKRLLPVLSVKGVL